MTETANFTLEQGLERYQQGESAASLLPEFKQLSDRAPKCRRLVLFSLVIYAHR